MPMTRRRFLSTSGALLAASALDARAAGTAAPRKLRLLILGGTAFLGPELVGAARGRGHTVTLFNRGKTRPELFPDVEKLHGDRDGKLGALEGRAWDAVIDTSGYVPRLVRASAELLAPRVPLYVFVSSISAYADSPKGLTEDSPVQALEDPKTEDVRGHYGALKAACEKAAAEATGGRALSVRPGLIVGPGDPTDRFTYWPLRLDRGGEVLCPGDGSDPAQVIDVRDLAAWMIRAVEDGRTGTVNAVGPAAPLTMAGLVEACRAPGSAATLAWVETAFLEKEKVAPWGDLPVWIPSGGASAGMARVSNVRAVAAGLRFRPLAETARDTLTWWKALPPERRQKPRAGLSPEREAAVLAAWKKAKAPATGR